MSKSYFSSSPLASRRFIMGTQPSASTLELMRTMLSGMHGNKGITIRLEPDGIVVEGSSQHPFAFLVTDHDLDEQVLSIAGGFVQNGNGIFYLQPAEVSMTGDPAFVVMRVDRNNIDGSAWLESTVSSVPADTPEYAYIPFYEYELVEGDPPSHVLKVVHHIGSVRV